ncbi:hypothetical protein MtrunA17_Chr8g0364221 [Medicago truncatula]|uniref:Transmembrane protein n=1 Tax=Medicago truncatula TaxID=3880 RepID=A0A396GJJ4_MEDTR|nr:hypothetical protein MtrunA17_Chr8g0364221 [Medicago truncatula]
MLLLVLYRSFVQVWFLFTIIVNIGSLLGGSKATVGFGSIYGHCCRRWSKQRSFCSLQPKCSIEDGAQLDLLVVLGHDRPVVGGCRSFMINPPL